MSDDKFKPGWLLWTTSVMQAEELKKKYLGNDWAAGLVAFSNREKSLADAGGMDGLRSCLTGRAGAGQDAEGFLMEAGLWRMDNDGVYEELGLEREGDGFFVQHWRLSTNETAKPPETGMQQCYFKKTETFLRGNIEIFKKNDKFPTIEVIVPEKRLRFYLTRGE